MTKQIYTVYDKKIKAFLEPHFTHDEESAIRTMVYSVNDSQHPFSKTPEDYTLYHLGDFNDNTGTVTPLPQNTNKLVCHLKDLIKQG